MIGANGETVNTAQPAKQFNAAPATVKPTEYVAYPEGFVRPTEYIAMPTVSVAAVVANKAPIASAGEGLVQIETDSGKLNTVVNVPAGNQGQPASRRRARSYEVYVENEPLVQIETQHTQG